MGQLGSKSNLNLMLFIGDDLSPSDKDITMSKYCHGGELFAINLRQVLFKVAQT